MEIVHTDGKDIDFIKLCKLLDENLNEIVGGDKQREQYKQYNTLEEITDVILIYIDQVAVGCASFKYYKEHVAEVKRVFVRKEFRGKGIGTLLMNELEGKAKSKGITTLILETGDVLVDAVEMYKKRGYKRIENYGQYRCMKDSICMQKFLMVKE